MSEQSPYGTDYDPTDLDRLIGRTVPRSPHARAAEEEQGNGSDPATESVDDSQPAGDSQPIDAPEPERTPATVPLEQETPAAAPEHADADPEPTAAAVTDPEPADPPATERDPGSDATPVVETAEADADPLVADERSPDPVEDTAPDPGPASTAGTTPVTEPSSDALFDLPADDVEDLGEELAEDADFEAALEALLLVVDAPVDEAALGSALGQPPSRVRATLPRMAAAYTADGRGIDLRRAGEGWRFYTRDRFAPYVERMLLDGQRARLTRAALETLAVVAYRQPVTRARVSAVRGVNCDGVLRTLLTRGLVEEAGTDEQTQGTLFRTTELFLERLGLSSVQELPPLAPLLPDIDAIDDM